MKNIFIILSLAVIFASCSKTLPPVDETPGTQTGEIITQEALTDISLTEVSDETGISELELGELMGEDIVLPAPTISEVTIEARGTEPFWYFTASGSTLIWQALGSLDIETETLTGVTLSGTGTSYNVSGTGITGIITLESCSDGMSDLSYDYKATVTKGASNFNGCANVD